MSVLCVLPARLESERLPRKPLLEVAGRPLVEWSWRAARAVPGVDEVWVATDAEEIAERVRAFGGTAVLTSRDAASGTDRVAEALARGPAREHDIVVNFQADEPFADPGAVARAVDAVRDGAPVGTVAAPIRSLREWRAEGVVKVVATADGRALYFSRAPIPHPRGAEPCFDVGSGGEAREPSGAGDEPRARYLRHVGVYVFRWEVLARWVALPPSPLERVEKLEQLRALEAGIEIRVAVGPPTEPGVDEPSDVVRAAGALARRERTRGGGSRTGPGCDRTGRETDHS